MGRSVATALVGLTFAGAAVADAPAATYPNRPVHVVVGFAAGGGADTATRLFAAKLSEAVPAASWRPSWWRTRHQTATPC
jgi:tripartite-type tricarboxylate transporter receptor subunit TctC